MPTVIDLRKADDPRDIVYMAVQALAEGKVIAVPSETVYALAASVLCVEAVERLAVLKQPGGPEGNETRRSTDQCWLAIAVKSVDEALDYMCLDSTLALRFARRCWPGPVTLVTPCDADRSAVTRFPQPVQDLILSESGDIGIRVVSHPLFEQMQKYCAGPVVVCGASRFGHPQATTGIAVAEQFGDDIPLVLDHGATHFGGPSTVVRVHGNRFKILREGVVETAAIRQYARPSIVLVCTGNTCRSPMAEALLKRQLDQRLGNSPSGTIIPHVTSVGLAAMPGEPASLQAVEVMKERGLDISDHSSQPFGEQIIRSADLILTMTQSHRNAILTRWPEAQSRVHTLRHDGRDITDPVGAPVEIYQACADQIESELTRWVDGLGPEWVAVPDVDGKGD